MPRGLKVSPPLIPLIANMIPIINICNFFQWKNICIMTFRWYLESHIETLDDNLVFQYARGRYFEAYKWQVSCFWFLLCKRKTMLSTLMPCVICVHFSQLVDHCVTWACSSKHYSWYSCQRISKRTWTPSVTITHVTLNTINIVAWTGALSSLYWSCFTNLQGRATSVRRVGSSAREVFGHCWSRS